MFALLLIGASVAAIKSLSAPELDSRPAPLLLYAMLAGLGVFLIHNLIDFSMSEAGALMLFAWLAGSVLGVRQPSVAGQKRRTATAAVALAVCVILWLTAAGFVWTPTASAEANAADAARALRTNRANEAMRLFNLAHQQQPLNADYAFRAAQAGMSNPVYNPVVLELLGIAIRENPTEPMYYLTRARYLLHSPEATSHRQEIKNDFERVVKLNPNDVGIRVEYADALASFNTPEDRAEAVNQYREALRFNSLLKEDEPKRLRGARVAEIEKKIAASGG
jgi:tetratricopeptide (TPR) repeat protein